MISLLPAIALRCARYPYEVLVLYMVVSVGIWSLPNSVGLLSIYCDQSASNEFHSMVIVARCLAVLHIFYQIKKLKLFKSVWLLFGLAIVGSLTSVMLSVLSGVIVTGLSDQSTKWFSILPILVLVTEMDFIHALLLISCKTATNTESVPSAVSNGIYRLAPRVIITSFIDIACMYTVIFYNSTVTDSAVNFAMQVSIYAIVFNLIQFFTLIPSVVTLIIYWFPSTPLRQIGDEAETNVLLSRALHSLKFGSGFEVFALMSSTFVLSQSKIILGILLRRYCPLYVVSVLRQYIAPYWPSHFSFSQTGIVTFLIVSLFRYLVLDNIRKSRTTKAVTRQKRTSVNHDNQEETRSLFDFDDNDHIRPLDILKSLLKDEKCDLMTNDEILTLAKLGLIRPYALEKVLGDSNRGVLIRRRLMDKSVFKSIPFSDYDFSIASRACCENIVGFCPIPVGIVGPILVDGDLISPLMATTEGALLASVNRGCKVIRQAGGTTTSIFKNEMSRAPCVSFDSASDSLKCHLWLNQGYNFLLLKDAFESTTRFGKLKRITSHPAGRYLYIRFGAETGDAMGMNMVSKGCEEALRIIVQNFPTSKVESISGNACTDKKPAAINWIEGRGKSIVAECEIEEGLLIENFKCTAGNLAALNVKKNLIGSCVAGSIGGFNAHAANVVAACFIACGQDAAQVVEGSQTMTLLEERKKENGKTYLHASVTMMSLEVAAIGGGTNLEPQKSIIQSMIGSCDSTPGAKACKLAAVIASTVLAGELSLMSSLLKGDLVQSHLKLNRIPSKPSFQNELKDHTML